MNKLLIFLLLIVSTSSFAQELNCEIFVNADRIEGTNKQRFKTLQTALTEFMNSTIWTEYSYEVEERIEVSINLILMQELSSDQFTASLQIQSRRPVYGSDYYSPTYNFKDTKFQFKYVEHQPMDFNEQNFTNNLISTMAYYAYLMLGVDDDTFAKKSGSMYFEKARNVVEFAQNKGYSGWDPTSNRTNRYWIIENLMADRYTPARDAFYQYHRLGLDVMSKDPAKGKNEIIKALKTLESVAKSNPNVNIVQNFMDAKIDELVDIFSAGAEVNLSEVKGILTTLSPTNQSKWDNIK